MAHPLVSIVTPSYNQGRYILATIDSVLAQNYPHVEYIVKDGGSTDGTQALLASYGQRFRWTSGPDDGQAAAINDGFSESKGDILFWLNSDDTLFPWACEWAVEQFKRYPEADVVYGDTLFVREDGAGMFQSTSKPFDYEEFIVSCHNPIPQPAAFFRRKAWYLTELDEQFSYFFDWDFWMRVGMMGKIVHEQSMTSTYRLHPQSKTCGKVPAVELERIYDRYFSYMPFVPPAIRRRQKEAMRNMHNAVAAYYRANGQKWREMWSRLRAISG